MVGYCFQVNAYKALKDVVHLTFCRFKSFPVYVCVVHGTVLLGGVFITVYHVC